MSIRDDVAGWLAEFTYKPGWRFTLLETSGGWEAEYLRVRCVSAETVCSVTGAPFNVNGWATWPVRQFEYANPLDMFKLLMRDFLREVEFHEVDEWARLNGERFREPHQQQEPVKVTLAPLGADS